MFATAFISCEKSDDKKYTACEVEGLEICEVDGDKVGIFENGEQLGQLIDLPSEISFEDAALQLCAVIEEELNEAGGCYECTGPNVPDFDVCKTEDGITLAGELVEDTENLSLEDAISALERNPNGAEELKGLSCKKN